jgi:glycosyltransferase involved in cell wall biosynthesis
MDDLLVITPGFPADEADDGCIPPLQAYVRACAAARPSSTIRVIATQYPFHREPYSWHGVRVYPCGGANRRWSKPLAWQRAMALGARLQRVSPASRVHSFWLGECAWLGQRIAMRSGATHVMTLMGQDARDERNWWRLVKNGGSRVAVLSQRHAMVFNAMSGRAPDAVIPFGLDPKDATPSSDRVIDLLFAGSLIPVKRPEVFVDVVARLAQRRSVRAVMVGARIPSGSTRVDELVREAGLAGRLEVLGERPRREVLALMARSRVLVHPSRYESEGYVFLEALMQGMSVVSFPVGIADAGERWRVVEDVPAMIAAVTELLDHPSGSASLLPLTMASTVAEYDNLFRTDRIP